MLHRTTKQLFYPGLTLIFFMVSTSACTKKEVFVYQTPKEIPAVSPPNDQLTTAPVSAPFRWTAPSSWKAVPASEMRLASFQLAGGDASIVVLEGDAGGLAANLNRWRGQIGLGALSESAMSAQLKPISTGLGKAKWIRITDPKKPESGILGAIISFNGSSIFVKLVAPLQILDAEQANFLALVGSLQADKTK